MIVIVYIASMFLFAGQETSSANFTNKFLAKLLPQLSRAELKSFVLILRKVGHVLAYGVLMYLMYNACHKTKSTRRIALPLAAVVTFLVAMADEMYQMRLVHRTGAWKDVAIDSGGIVFVSLVIWLRETIRKKKTSKPLEKAGDEGVN